MLQHLWAEMSEKLSDVIDPSIKYGGGEEYIQTERQESTRLIANIEDLELDIADLEKEEIDSNLKVKLENLRERIGQIKRGLAKKFNELNELFGINSKL